MRNFTFKRQLLFVMFMLLGCLSIQAANDGLITKQITIKLDEAGTLPDRISESRKFLITNLKIVGEVNGLRSRSDDHQAHNCRRAGSALHAGNH